jgi:hypothetical protein
MVQMAAQRLVEMEAVGARELLVKEEEAAAEP